MSQAEGLDHARVRSRVEHAKQVRELKGVVWLVPRMGSMAGEWAEGSDCVGPGGPIELGP